MGKYLQIRVSAWTYSEEDVAAAWPALIALAWPRPARPDERRGVLELAAALENELSFGDWPRDVAEALRDDIARIGRLRRVLEEALSDWEPRKSNMLSDELEDELTKLNDKAPRP